MPKQLMSKHTVWGFAALLAGIAAGAWYADRTPNSIYAMTAQGSDKKSMVTVPLDEGMEAVVALDHITCDLTAYVLDRFSGKFFMQYRYNVGSDFALQHGKLPRFVMVAGQANFRQFTGNERIADGVVYISEENSGQVVAYGLPWNTQFRTNTRPPQRRQFVPLDFAKTRFVDIRES